MAWVAGSNPSVNVAFVSAPSMSVTSNVVVGGGSNPAVAVDRDGNVSLVYVGPDNRIRYHALDSSLDCIGGGAPATCALTPSEQFVATPISAGAFLRTIDIEADGAHFWVAARTTEGELLLRLDTAVRDHIFRTDGVSSWVSIAALSGAPLMARGGGTGASHRALGCP